MIKKSLTEMQLEVEISKFDLVTDGDASDPSAILLSQLRKFVIGPYSDRL